MLRKIEAKDLPALLELEQAIHVSPWTLQTFEICLQPYYLGWLMEEGSRLIAYMVVLLQEDQCHILNVGVAFPYRRQGYAEQLLRYVLGYAKSQQIGMAYLEVRRSNVAALNLYRKFHFLQIAERKNYYVDAKGTEDALIFAKDLSTGIAF